MVAYMSEFGLTIEEKFESKEIIERELNKSIPEILYKLNNGINKVKDYTINIDI